MTKMTNFTLQRSRDPKPWPPRELVEIPVSSSVWKMHRRSHSHRHYTVVCDSDVEIRAAPTYSDEVDFHMENWSRPQYRTLKSRGSDDKL